jgi:hypothetical protein
MEYSVGMSQVLSAFPSWLGCVVMLILAWVGDKYHIRGPLLLINCAFGIAGACLLVCASEFILHSQSCLNTFFLGLGSIGRGTLSRNFLYLHRRLWRCALLPYLSSQQHPWPLEACLLQRNHDRLWWYRRCRRLSHLPLPGSTNISSWYLRLSGLQCRDYHDCYCQLDPL